ncbi:hypothetical protein GRI89_01890 [Altererythrobacter salegens]|uniref:Rap1a immunity protein domain-containing protein n=1 Tax=Croceibacterium salegens TaxID=1737568 RepID=A0A6I4SR35_9SPHN|nr:Rap1a/Tai family immunity protein [Croceibacterium salegens]MXO58295.1 hypothetical protein [Croceibacterium salegens]
MRKTTGYLIAMVLATSGSVARADDGTPTAGVFKTGEQLYEVCTSEDDDEIDRCYWYLMGSWDAMTFYADIDLTDRYACLPEDAVVGELRDVVVSYLRGADRSKSAISLTFNALTDYYECE